MRKIIKVITKVLEAVCFVCMVGLTVVVALQVFTRQMKISWPWCEELSRFMLIWLCFSGCAVALVKKLHLSVNFFVNLAPERIRKVIYVIDQLIIMAFFGSITFYGFTLSSRSMNILSPTMHIPMGLVYVVLPITSLLTVLVLVLELFIKKEENEEVDQ